MGASIEHQMTELYGFVDDFLKAHPKLAHWRHSPHAQPPFSDAEVLTIALLQGVFAVATLKQTYRLVAQNWRSAFPLCPPINNGWRGCTTCCPRSEGCWPPPVPIRIKPPVCI